MLPIKIALRFLKHSKGQTFLITLGIAIGVSVQLFIGLLIQGLQTSLIDKTIGSSSHITITSTIDNKTIQNYNEIIEEISKNSNVKYVSKALDRPAIVDIDTNNESVLIRGLSLAQADGIYKFSNALTEGSMPNYDEAIIGKEFSELSGYKAGDTIVLVIPGLGEKNIKIAGVFDLNVTAINKTWIVADLSTVQTLFETNDILTSIEIQIEEVFKSGTINDEINNFLPMGYISNDWQSQNEALLSGLNGQSISSIMIQIFVIIAVVLGIASVLAISVLQKSKQLGILKAMGIKNKSASLIFLAQGFILGIMGAVAGIILGLLLSFAFSTFALNADGTALIPLNIDIKFIILSAAIAIVASMGAALIPAIKTSKLDPIEVIRNA